MDDHAVTPYYFPTTVMVVDDNRTFLENFSLELDESLAFRLFDSPGRALSWFRTVDTRSRLHRTCVRQHRDAIGWPAREHLVGVDLAAVEEEVTNPDRFRDVSVVIVDQVMPEMTGLTLCHQLSDRPVKRILLTGAGDDKLAISAFNSGLIHRFVRKGQDDAADLVNQAITELQYEYFRDITRPVAHFLSSDEAPFLVDPAFVSRFQRLTREQRVTEHYFTSEPNGFLLLTGTGRTLRLIVLTDSDMTAHWEIARDQNAPPTLLRMLESRAAVPYFWRTGGYYRPELYHWEDDLYPAETVGGVRRYYMALVEDPPLYRKQGWRIASYAEFLNRLDDERILD